MAGQSLQLLVVDDDPEIRTMLELRLTQRGYRVLTAADGDQALALARQHQPAVVLLDVMMPGKNGWEVARALRSDPATADIKIIMVTAIGEGLNEMTSPLYSDAHIDKPIVFEKLEALIRGQDHGS